MLRTYQSRCIFIFLLVVGGFSALAWRLIEIQHLHPSSYLVQSEKDKETITVLHGIRGHIVDRHDQTIARSVPEGELMINARHFSELGPALRALAWEKCSKQPEWHGLEIASQKKKLKEAEKELGKIYPNKCKELEKLYLNYAVDHIAPSLSVKRDDIIALLNRKAAKKQTYFQVFSELDEETCDLLEETLDTNKIGGFELIKTSRRQYTSHIFAPHVIGYTSLNYLHDENSKYRKEIAELGILDHVKKSNYKKEFGGSGVELELQDELAGKDGYRKCITGASGSLIGIKPGITQPPTHGKSVMLTIDMQIQHIVQEELAAAIQETNAARGCIIVIDPLTGEVLGMANHPTFSLKNADPKSDNLAIRMDYEPGSVIKPFAFAAAIDKNHISRKTQINCHNGQYLRGNTELTEDHPHGMLSAEWVMGHSSNLGTFMIAERIGRDNYFRWLSDFGFGKISGVQLPNERAGACIPTTKLVEYFSMTHGYKIAVTPIQLACAYSVIANGGMLRKPLIIKSIINPDGSIFREYQPENATRVISENAAREARIGLKTVLAVDDKGNKGTGTAAKVLGYDVCGKTGTAEKWMLSLGKYSKELFYCSFAGMLPADSPQIVCVVVIDSPICESRTGGAVAAPVFSRVCSRVADHLHLKPTVAIPPHVANQ